MCSTTTESRSLWIDWLLPGAFALLLASALPVLALLAFTLRPVVITGAVVALAALLSPLVLVPRMRGRWTADVAPEQAYRGLRLARDVFLHPGHTWAWVHGDAIVGADDIVQAALGPIDEVALPPEGRHVRRGEPLFSLRHGDRRLELPSPVSGTVVRSNGALRAHPELINTRPFSRGWVARVHPDDDLIDDQRHLLRGRKAWTWFQREVDRVIGEPEPVSPPPADPIPEESTLAADLHDHFDDAAWRQFVAAVTRGETLDTRVAS